MLLIAECCQIMREAKVTTQITLPHIVVDTACLTTTRMTSLITCQTGPTAHTFCYWWLKLQSWYEVYIPGWAMWFTVVKWMFMAWHNQVQTKYKSYTQ